MGEHETGKPEAESSCHDVQGDDFMREAKFQLESLDFEPSLFETNVVNSTRNDILKISSGTNSRSHRIEVEEGELVEGIEANDASGLLEQFLEYVEKQDLEAFENLQDVHTDAMDPLFHDVVTNTKAREENFSVHSSSVGNGTAKNECNDEMDNHKTDHNYACRGFPKRTPSFSSEQSKCLESRSRKYKDSNSGSDSENRNEKRKLSGKERRGKYSSRRRSSRDRDAHRSRSRSPLRHSSCHYKKNSKGDRSSSDDESHCRRRHSKCHRHSSFSSDEKRFSSSDEESIDERRRHDPRQSGSGRLQSKLRHSRDSDGNSYSVTKKRRNHRNRRVHSPDFLEKDFHYKKEKTMYDIEQERKMGFKFNPKIKDSAKEERCTIYIGKITRGTTEDEVRKRFRPFGPIEKVTVHFREKGDNYAFVTFFEHSSAAEAIEQGNDDPGLPVLDICFGGRRKFCGGSYVDFDLNNSYLEEQETSRPPSADEMDFDTLLKLSQKSVKSRKASCKGR